MYRGGFWGLLLQGASPKIRWVETNLCWEKSVLRSCDSRSRWRWSCFCLEDIKPPLDFLEFPLNNHHLREFGLYVNILLDLRVVDEIVWPFSGKTIRSHSCIPRNTTSAGNAGNSHCVTKNPAFLTLVTFVHPKLFILQASCFSLCF